jgi:Bacterial regulatory proteins, tetR family
LDVDVRPNATTVPDDREPMLNGPAASAVGERQSSKPAWTAPTSPSWAQRGCRSFRPERQRAVRRARQELPGKAAAPRALLRPARAQAHQNPAHDPTEARRLFNEKGYAQTTVEEIADAAAISPPTFFRYFPSNEDVVMRDEC